MRPSPGPSMSTIFPKKTSSGIVALKHVRLFINQDTATKHYKALIKPYSHYCSSVWNGLIQHLSNTLQKLQNYESRINK